MIRCFAVGFLLFFLFPQTILHAQSFGGNPSSIKWRQVNTPAAKVIYPKGLDSIANRVATLSTLVNKSYAGNIGNDFRKVSIVLQSNNTVSNAYVQLAPYRSEFYLTPPQNPFHLGSLRWADNLVIHEFRHLEQYSNFNHGFSKFFSILLGEQGQAFANALAVPDWFFEGDAVWNETAFSRQGRGRLPQNYTGFKSLQAGSRNYTFLKLRNGSFKHYVPNHYELGYLLVAYGREKYGDSIWHHVTKDAVKFKGVFYPWQKAVKRYTQKTYGQFTTDALNYFRQQWKNENREEPGWITANEKNNVINYSYPYPGPDSSIIVLKTSYRQIPVFVKVYPSGREEKIAVKDIGYDDYFSYKNGKIIYTALKPDERWGNRDFAVIRMLDLETGKTSSVSAKGKYFSPDINEAGNLIVVVNADPSRTCVLQLLDRSGKELQSFTADSSLFYSQPKFLNDSTIIAAARMFDGKMGWLKWHTNNKSYEWLKQPEQQMIGYPVIKNDSLFYTGTAGTSDALFVIPLKDKTPAKLVATWPEGIYQGFASGNNIIATAFTSGGYRLGNFRRQDSTVISTPLLPLYAVETYNNKPDLTATATNVYPSSKYSKAHRLFNFHSWQPEISESEYGVSLLGENVLSSMFSEIFYTWNRNENSHELGAAAHYGGWYVQPFLSGSQTWNREINLNADTTVVYNETGVTGGLQLPLNLTFGRTYRFLTLSGSFTSKNVKWQGFAKDFLDNSNVNYITARAVYSVQVQRAVQQIYPRFAESFTAVYNKAFNVTAWQYLLNGTLYLPGLFNNHNIVLNAAWQSRDTMQQYIFTNSFPFSRGYDDVNFPQMLRLGFNYHLPLFYPDWGFGNIVYFRRIRMNGFYDYTLGKSLRTGNTYPFSTVGTEIFFDTKWWNQLPLTVGFRYSRLLDNEFRGNTQPNQWEIILPVNLLPR